MDKVQVVLVEILSNCSKLEAFKDIVGPSQRQQENPNGGHHTTPSSQDDGLFVSDQLFSDAHMELMKTYERTGGTTYPDNSTPPGFDLGYVFGLSPSRHSIENIHQFDSTQQGGSRDAGETGSESDSEVESSTPLERSPHLDSKSSIGDALGNIHGLCIEDEHHMKSGAQPPRKKMLAVHFISLSS